MTTPIGSRTRQLIAVLCVVAVVVWFGPGVAGAWSDVAAAFFGRRSQWWDAEDFSVFYNAGALVAAGQSHLLHTPSAYTAAQHAVLETHQDVTLGYYNPAFFAVFFAPLSWLSFDRAYQVWTGINLALLALNAWLLWRTGAALDRAWRVAIIVAFVTMYPVAFVLRLGQFSLILMASWSSAYLALRSGRDRLAGLVLAPLLIKPELLIPVALLLAWKRRGDTLAVLMPIAVVAALGSIVLLGPAAAWDYVTYLRESAASGTGNMYGWNGLLSATLSPDRPGATATVAVPLALATLALASAAWRGRWDASGAGFATQWLVLTIATVLSDLHLYLQDVVLIIPPAVAVLAGARGRSRVIIGVAMALGWVILSWGSRPSVEWHINLFSIYIAVVLVAAVASVLRRHTQPSVETRDVEPDLMRAA